MPLLSFYISPMISFSNIKAETLDSGTPDRSVHVSDYIICLHNLTHAAQSVTISRSRPFLAKYCSFSIRTSKSIINKYRFGRVSHSCSCIHDSIYTLCRVFCIQVFHPSDLGGSLYYASFWKAQHQQEGH